MKFYTVPEVEKKNFKRICLKFLWFSVNKNTKIIIVRKTVWATSGQLKIETPALVVEGGGGEQVAVLSCLHIVFRAFNSKLDYFTDTCVEPLRRASGTILSLFLFSR